MNKGEVSMCMYSPLDTYSRKMESTTEGCKVSDSGQVGPLTIECFDFRKKDEFSLFRAQHRNIRKLQIQFG